MGSNTHLWARGLPAPQWDRGIRGVLERQGDQWSLGVLGAQGGQLDRAGQWTRVPKASLGARLTVQFVLWENKGAGVYSREDHQKYCYVKHKIHGAVFQKEVFLLIDGKWFNCFGVMNAGARKDPQPLGA